MSSTDFKNQDLIIAQENMRSKILDPKNPDEFIWKQLQKMSENLESADCTFKISHFLLQNLKDPSDPNHLVVAMIARNRFYLVERVLKLVDDSHLPTLVAPFRISEKEVAAPPIIAIMALLGKSLQQRQSELLEIPNDTTSKYHGILTNQVNQLVQISSQFFSATVNGLKILQRSQIEYSGRLYQDIARLLPKFTIRKINPDVFSVLLKFFPEIAGCRIDLKEHEHFAKQENLPIEYGTLMHIAVLEDHQDLIRCLYAVVPDLEAREKGILTEALTKTGRLCRYPKADGTYEESALQISPMGLAILTGRAEICALLRAQRISVGKDEADTIIQCLNSHAASIIRHIQTDIRGSMDKLGSYAYRHHPKFTGLKEIIPTKKDLNLDQLQTKRHELQAELKKSQDNAAKLQSIFNKNQSEIDRLEITIKEIQETYTHSLEAIRAETEQCIAGKEASLKSLKNQISQLEDQLKSRIANQSRAQELSETLKETTESQQKELATAHNALKSAEAIREISKDELHGLLVKTTVLQRQNFESASLLSKLESQYLSLQKALEEQATGFCDTPSAPDSSPSSASIQTTHDSESSDTLKLSEYSQEATPSATEAQRLPQPPIAPKPFELQLKKELQDYLDVLKALLKSAITAKDSAFPFRLVLTGSACQSADPKDLDLKCFYAADHRLPTAAIEAVFKDGPRPAPEKFDFVTVCTRVEKDFGVMMTLTHSCYPTVDLAFISVNTEGKPSFEGALHETLTHLTQNYLVYGKPSFLDLESHQYYGPELAEPFIIHPLFRLTPHLSNLATLKEEADKAAFILKCFMLHERKDGLITLGSRHTYDILETFFGVKDYRLYPQLLVALYYFVTRYFEARKDSTHEILVSKNLVERALALPHTTDFLHSQNWHESAQDYLVFQIAIRLYWVGSDPELQSSAIANLKLMGELIDAAQGKSLYLPQRVNAMLEELYAINAPLTASAVTAKPPEKQRTHHGPRRRHRAGNRPRSATLLAPQSSSTSFDAEATCHQP